VFVETIYAIFEKYTGNKIDTKEFIYVPEYSHGGMSSGSIDPGIL